MVPAFLIILCNILFLQESIQATELPLAIPEEALPFLFQTFN